MKSEIILLIISGTLLTVGAYLWQRGSHLLRHGKRVLATVIDHEEKANRGSSGPETYYYPIVEYVTDDNQHLAHTLGIGSDHPLDNGTLIPIIYDPDDPTVVEMDSRGMLAILPRVLVVMGVCGLVLLLLELFDIIPIMS